jgi:hypothetical protein
MATISPKTSARSSTPEHASSGSLHHRWLALQERSAEIARVADLAPEAVDPIMARFDEATSSHNSHALEVARRGLEDMELLVEMGLSALREVEARGQEAHAPALALWREFYHAREAVLGLMEPEAA